MGNFILLIKERRHFIHTLIVVINDCSVFFVRLAHISQSNSSLMISIHSVSSSVGSLYTNVI